MKYGSQYLLVIDSQEIQDAVAVRITQPALLHRKGWVSCPNAKLERTFIQSMS
jgi:hypothetical protein